MGKSQMKNIVVLRNLPSNLVEEAFVIVKSQKTAKKFEYIDKKENSNRKENNSGTSDYIIREAESVLYSYISGVENKDKKKKELKINKKYKSVKIYSIIITIILFAVLIFQ